VKIGIRLVLIVTLLLLARTTARAEYRIVTGPGGTYHTYTADPARETIELVSRGVDGSPVRDFERLEAVLRKGGRTLRFATNAGIYMEDLRSLGWHVEHGRELRPLLTRTEGYGNFYMQPNGALMLFGSAAPMIRATGEIAPELPRFRKELRFATQSGPLLVRNGVLNRTFRAGSPNLRVRSGVGIDGRGRVVFVLSDAPVTFHDIASLFGRSLGCPDALYLDGEISAMRVPGISLPEPRVPFGALFAVSDRR
jgi:uncharacterized protein YigE (DUF2233 family)